jgi:aminopeptidase N
MVRQSCPPTPGQPHKLPFHLPLAMGLLAEDGTELCSRVLELTEAEQVFHFDAIDRRPVPSLLRGFSAPVKLDYPYTDQQLLLLLGHDTDGFNRWDAGQRLCVRLLQQQIEAWRRGEPLRCEQTLVDAWRDLLDDASLDPAMVAQLLRLPSEAQLSELADEIDVDAIHEAREFMRIALARALEPHWLTAYQRCDAATGPYSPDAASIGLRSLKNLALAYLIATGAEPWLELAHQQFGQSDNMTDQQAALTLVAHSGFREVGAELLETFYLQWQHEPLVMNQWLAIQASDPAPGALERVIALSHHPVFDVRNPNKLRALIGGFCNQNLVQFHAEDGRGYAWLADWILRLDRQNPQIAARLLTPLTRWKRYDPVRRAMMREQLQRMMDTTELSADVYEVVSKSLA